MTTVTTTVLHVQVVSINMREFVNLTDVAVETMAWMCPHLRAVDFTCCHHLTRDAAALLLSKCPLLTSVTFRGCGEWVDSFIKGVCEALKSGSASITVLEVGHNDLDQVRHHFFWLLFFLFCVRCARGPSPREPFIVHPCPHTSLRSLIHAHAFHTFTYSRPHTLTLVHVFTRTLSPLRTLVNRRSAHTI